MLVYEAIISILIFSFVPLTIKFTHANPFTIGLFRLLISVVGGFFLWRKKLSFSTFFTKESWRLVLIGFFFFCHWITYFYSIKVSGASVCVLGMSTYGIQLIFFGSFLLGYQVKRKNFIALFIVLIGVSQLIPEWNLANNFTQGLLWALLSASFYSWLPILHQKTNPYFDRDVRVFAQFFFALIAFSFFFSYTDWNLNSKDWFALLFLAVFGTLIAHTFWARVTSQISTTTSGIIYYLITPFALIFSHFLLGETLSLKQVISAILILCGAFYNSWNRTQNA